MTQQASITREQIETVLLRTDKVGMHAVGRALVHLFNRQTEDEKINQDVKHDNGMGFQPCHAEIGTSMALFYQKNGFLTPKQVAYWQRAANPKKEKSKARIARYSRQLKEEADKRAAMTKTYVITYTLNGVGLERVFAEEQKAEAYKAKREMEEQAMREPLLKDLNFEVKFS